MKPSPETTVIEVDLDGRKATEKAKDLTAQMAKAKVELKKAFEKNDAEKVAQYEMEIEKLSKAHKRLKKDSFDAQKVLDNLSDSTLPELTKARKKLEGVLKSKAIKRKSKDWDHYSKQLQIVAEEERKVRAEMKGTDASLKKRNSLLTKQAMMIGGWVGGLRLVSAEYRKNKQEFDSYQRAYSGLSALTGLQGKELEWLKNKAKETSTMTTEAGMRITQSADDILNAYMKVGSARPELLKNKEALHELTMEAILLSNAGAIPLDAAVSSLTGSLNQMQKGSDQARRFVNVIAAGSKEGAGNIEFINTVIGKAGTEASLARIEIEQLGAAIETVAPNYEGKSSELGTSMQRVLMRLRKAGIGMKDGVMDFNLVIDQLNDMVSKGVDLKPLVGEHETFVNVLRQNKQAYNDYLKAMTDTNTATEQARINTDTEAAREKQRLNRLKLLRIELGEKQIPLQRALSEVQIAGYQGLSVLIGFVTNYKESLITAAAVIALYNKRNKIKQFWEAKNILEQKRGIVVTTAKIVQLRLKALWTKKNTIAVRRNIVALEAQRASMMAIPWMAVVSGIILAAQWLYNYSRRAKAVSEVEKIMNQSRKETMETSRQERASFEMMYSQLKKTNAGTKERIELADKLQNKFPGIISAQDLYKAGLKELTTAEDDYRKKLEMRLRLSVREDQFAALIKAQLEKEDKLNELRGKAKKIKNEVLKAQQESEGKGKYYKAGAGAGSKNKLTNLSSQAGELRKQINDLKAEKKRIGDEMDKIRKGIETGSGSGGGGSEVDKTSLIVKLQKELETIKKNDPEYTEAQIAAKNKKIQVVEKEIARLKALGIQSKKEEKAEETKAKKIKEYRESLVKSSGDLIEAEKKEHEERIKKAGLTGKKLKDMSAEDKEVLERLQKIHSNNLNKIEDDNISKFLKKKQDANSHELAELERKHAKELRETTATGKALKEIKERQQKEEQELIKGHTEEISAIIQDLLKKGSFEGINLADSLLTEDQKAKLIKMLDEIGMKYDEIFAKREQKKDAWAGVDIMGYSAEDWGEFFDSNKKVDDNLQAIQMTTKLMSSTFSTYDKFVTAAENKRFKEFQKKQNKERKALEKKYKRGAMSAEEYNDKVAALDTELDLKKTELEQKQAKRQKTMSIFDALTNTAVGATAALKYDPSGILSAIVTAMGLAQVALIASQPLPGKEKGGYLVEREDGQKFNANYDPDKRGYIDRPTVITGEYNKREFVVNNEALQNPEVAEIIDMIDVAQKSGTVKQLKLPTNDVKLNGLESGGFVSGPTGNSAGYSDDVEINYRDVVVDLSEVVKEIRELRKSLESGGIPAIIKKWGKNSLDEGIQDINNFNKRTRR